jgi:hypothetical protein
MNPNAINLLTAESISTKFFQTKPGSYPWTKESEYPLVQAVEGNIRTATAQIISDILIEQKNFLVCCETRYKFAENDPPTLFDILVLDGKTPVFALELKSKEASFNVIWRSELGKYKKKRECGMSRPHFPVAFLAVWWGDKPKSDQVPPGYEIKVSPGLFNIRKCHILYFKDIRSFVWNA